MDQVFVRQDGVCANPGCRNPLAAGFHRHHKDGDPSNTSTENCELLCVGCHFAKKGEQTEGHDPLKTHRELQAKIIEAIFRAVGLAEDKTMTGSTLERVLTAYEKVLAESWKQLSPEIEYPNPVFAAWRNMIKTGMLQEEYLKGFKDGIRSIRVELGGEKD